MDNATPRFTPAVGQAVAIRFAAGCTMIGKRVETGFRQKDWHTEDAILIELDGDAEGIPDSWGNVSYLFEEDSKVYFDPAPTGWTMLLERFEYSCTIAPRLTDGYRFAMKGNDAYLNDKAEAVMIPPGTIARVVDLQDIGQNAATSYYVEFEFEGTKGDGIWSYDEIMAGGAPVADVPEPVLPPVSLEQQPFRPWGMHVILAGNPLEGLRVYGPFKTYDDALVAAERFDFSDIGGWWIAPLHSMEEVA